MRRVKIPIKTQFFSFVTFLCTHMKFFIKGHIIIIHGITCVSNDIIDDVIEFAKFSVADVLKPVKKWHFDQMPFF